MSYRVAMTHRLGTLTEAWVAFEDMSTPWRWSKLPYMDHNGSQILALAVGSKGYWFLPRDVPLPRLVWLTSELREDRR